MVCVCSCAVDSPALPSFFSSFVFAAVKNLPYFCIRCKRNYRCVSVASDNLPVASYASRLSRTQPFRAFCANFAIVVVWFALPICLCAPGCKQAAVGGNGNGSGHKKSAANVIATATAATATKDRAKNGFSQYKSSISLFLVHMVALLRKRYLTFRRDKKMLAFVVFMPALFVFAGIMTVRLGSQKDQPSLRLTPEVKYVLCMCVHVFFIAAKDFCLSNSAPR